MLNRVVVACSLIAGLWSGLDVSTAQAQVFGTFKWQTQPYCNVLTLTVVQQGGIFQLVGSDDLCGGGTAPITGTAVINGGGVAFGVAVALPGGAAAHVSSTISIATLSGTWADADGNGGPFTFVTSGLGGAPRPAPAAATAITSVQLSPTIFAGTGVATTIARSDHTHDDRYYTKAQVDAKVASPISLQAAAFTARHPNTTSYDFASSNQLYVTAGTDDEFVAPVQLPQGSRVLGIRAGLWDNSATVNLRVTLYRFHHLTPSFSMVASATSAGAAAAGVFVQAAAIAGADLVDNNAYGYVMRLDVTGGDWVTEGLNLRFHGVIIEYACPALATRLRIAAWPLVQDS